MFPATLSNLGRFPHLAVVNAPRTETRRGNTSQFPRTSQDVDRSVCPQFPNPNPQWLDAALEE